MMIETRRFVLESQRAGHADALHAYYTRNAAHLARWAPKRPPGYHDLDAWQARVAAQEEAQRAGTRLSIIARDGERIVAVANFNGIERGPSRSCTLGYSRDADWGGLGTMQEVLDAAIAHIFSDLGITRIQAAYLPENHRSARLLHRLGFEREGFVRDYLKIAGRWRDHVLTAKRAPQR